MSSPDCRKRIEEHLLMLLNVVFEFSNLGCYGLQLILEAVILSLYIRRRWYWLRFRRHAGWRWTGPEFSGVDTTLTTEKHRKHQQERQRSRILMMTSRSHFDHLAALVTSGSAKRVFAGLPHLLSRSAISPVRLAGHFKSVLPRLVSQESLLPAVSI